MSQLCGALLSMVLVEKLGRKILLMLSGLGMCFALTGLGVYFYIHERIKIACPPTSNDVTSNCIDQNGKFDQDILDSLSWLPLTCLMLFMIVFAAGIDKMTDSSFSYANAVINYLLGYGQVPWTINAEIFTQEAKETASSIAFTFNWFCAFLVTKFFPDLEALIGPDATYFTFAAVCVIGVAYVAVFVPETKGCHPTSLKERFKYQTVFLELKSRK